MTAEFDRDITEEDILVFARNSGDQNPLHIDPNYARSNNFEGCLAHGAFQIGLASAILGMHLPGRDVLLGSVSCRFPSPLYYPCHVFVRGELTSWSPTTLGGAVKVTVQNERRVATAEIHMGFTLRESGTASLSAAAAIETRPLSGRKWVLLTGAAGGIGAALLPVLCEEYSILAVTHRNELAPELKKSGNIVEIHADLMTENWTDQVVAALGGDSLYAVVHAAWPGAPHGGLLQSSDETLISQLMFGASGTIRLARLLCEHATQHDGRLILLGSIVGSIKPSLNLSCYSLGKSTLENTAQLLAPELALKGITVNTISPSLVPVGINKQVSNRGRLKEMSQIPIGRLCQPEDVAGLVCYLLSARAGFISGQVIGLTGAQM